MKQKRIAKIERITSETKIKLELNIDGSGKADRILLPGVGAFAPAIDHLKHSGMLEALHEKVQSGTPMLGVWGHNC